MAYERTMLRCRWGAAVATGPGAASLTAQLWRLARHRRGGASSGRWLARLRSPPAYIHMHVPGGTASSCRAKQELCLAIGSTSMHMYSPATHFCRKVRTVQYGSTVLFGFRRPGTPRWIRLIGPDQLLAAQPLRSPAGQAAAHAQIRLCSLRVVGNPRSPHHAAKPAMYTTVAVESYSCTP
jgi:hypothetical protein